jgi:hypothetical protein
MSWTTVEELCELSEHMQCALHTDYTQISSTSMARFPGKISWSKRPGISIVPKEKNQQGLCFLGFQVVIQGPLQ